MSARVQIPGAKVLVTGAGSGIGEATARRFARAGARVVCADIDETTAAATAQACRDAGAEAHHAACDVADVAAVDALAAQHPDVDVLINNAGVGVAGPFLDATPEDWEWLRSINLDGVAHGCRAFGARMVQRRRGHVVNVASMAGFVPHRDLPAYCATKSAVIALSQCLRADWRAHGVGVSVVCPGVIRTPIAANTRYRGAAEGRREAAIRALGRGHPPAAVADAILGAVEHDRDIVPVGVESHLAFRVLRLAPGPLQGLLARAAMP